MTSLSRKRVIVHVTNEKCRKKNFEKKESKNFETLVSCIKKVSWRKRSFVKKKYIIKE